MNSLNRWGALASAAALGAVGVVAAGAAASAGSDDDQPFTVTARLSGYHETPLALSTAGSGSVRLRVDPAAQTITYTLRYTNLESTVTQSHIHFGSRSQSGGISAWLCGNPQTTPVPISPPTGTPACPPTNPGVVTGTLTAANVVGPAGQGIASGEFAELVRAMRANSTYANVHSADRPSGEIRNQLVPHDH